MPKFGNLFEYGEIEHNGPQIIYHEVNYQGVYYEGVSHDTEKKTLKFYISYGDSVPDIAMESNEPYKILNTKPPVDQREFLIESMKTYLKAKQPDCTEENLTKMAAYLADTVEDTLADFD
jgi:hypothetical protein